MYLCVCVWEEGKLKEMAGRGTPQTPATDGPQPHPKPAHRTWLMMGLISVSTGRGSAKTAFPPSGTWYAEASSTSPRISDR